MLDNLNRLIAFAHFQPYNSISNAHHRTQIFFFSAAFIHSHQHPVTFFGESG